MDQLPDEVLALILSRLGPRELMSAARVCKRWAAFTRAHALHVRKRGEECRLTYSTHFLFVTARRVSLASALPLAPRLRSLTVNARSPLNVFAMMALQQLKHLDHLDVFIRGRLLDARLLPAVQIVSSLIINETISRVLLRSLAKKSRLRELHMYGRAQYYPTREMTALLVSRSQYLNELTLRCAELPDYGYAAIGQCSRLTVLRLYACWMLTSNDAAHLAQLKNLRILHITGARMLRTRALQTFIGTLCRSLEEIDLSAGWFADEHVEALTARTPFLRVVEMWRCHLTPTGVTALASGLPNLWELDVDLVLGTDEMKVLSDHPTLRRLRCSKAGVSPRPSLVLTDAGSRYGRGAMRVHARGEGWRAELFYYWSSMLRPLPDDMPPYAFEDDEEDDYTLLGSEPESDDD